MFIVKCMSYTCVVVSNQLVFFLLDNTYFLFLSPQLPPHCNAHITDPNWTFSFLSCKNVPHHPLETEFKTLVQNPSAKHICMSVTTARWG
jgi:hypothetical protein